MKKIISLVVATMMAVSMMAVSALPAMAADNVSSPTAAVLQQGKAQTTVNGETKQGVTYTVDTTKASKVTFSYKGEGTFKSWSDNLGSLGLAEGTDYTKATNADNSIVITFMSQKAITAWNEGKVVVNAIVEFATTTAASTTAATTEATDAKTTTKATTSEDNEETTVAKAVETTKASAKKNTSSKSPATGSSTAAVAGVVAAGAAFAVMVATKKKNND
jgi:hypothetical protein